MSRIPATEFKARCLELMGRVAERGASYTITKRGKPVARLMPLEVRQEDSLFGRLRGMVEEAGDIMSPVADPEDWEAVREWDELHGGQPQPVKKRSRRRR
jgi:prevent-host-death family protein